MTSNHLDFELSRRMEPGLIEMKFCIPIIVNLEFTTGERESFLASHILYEDWAQLELSTNKDSFSCPSDLIDRIEIITGSSMLVITLVDPE